MRTITLANGNVIWFKSAERPAERPDNLYGQDVWGAVITETRQPAPLRGAGPEDTDSILVGWTVRQVARATGYTEFHIRYLCRQGRLKARRLSGRWLIDSGEIEALQKRNKTARWDVPEEEITQVLEVWLERHKAELAEAGLSLDDAAVDYWEKAGRDD